MAEGSMSFGKYQIGLNYLYSIKMLYESSILSLIAYYLMQNLGKLKIWLDCDPGNDDAMAIIMALFSQECELVGLSTVFGNNSLEKVTRNALRLLSCVNRKDIPVYKGAKQSLNKKIIDAGCHGKEGLFGAEKLEPEFEPITEGSLYDLIKARLGNERFTFIMTGAQTNGAVLFTEHPEILAQIDKVIFMGGSAGFGNATPNAEFNLYADPLACKQVVQICQEHKKPLVMVALDITHTVLVTDEVLRRVKELNTPFTDWCSDMLYEFALAYREEEFEFPPLHDPVAMYYALHPEDFKTRFINVEVEAEEGLCFGRTVCDKFNFLKREKNVIFCENVDLEKFWKKMIDCIKEAASVAKIKA